MPKQKGAFVFMLNLQKIILDKTPKNVFYKSKLGCVVCADALDFLNSLNGKSADIVFLDPPFNLGKQYGRKKEGADRLREDEYFDFIAKVIDRSCCVLREGGSLFLYHIPRWNFKFAEYLDRKLVFQHWIAVSMKNGFVRGPRLYPAHYALLHFSKGKPSVLARPKVPIQTCRHCGKDIKDYGGYRKYLSHGVNLADIWDDTSPVRHQHTKHRKPNELPKVVLERILLMSGTKGGLLVDPFAGSGTAPVMAMQFGMHFAVCDREKEYCRLIAKRLKDGH